MAAAVEHTHEERDLWSPAENRSPRSRSADICGAAASPAAFRGTPSLDDWVAYIVNGTKSRKLILADHWPERKVKALLAKIQPMSKKEVEKLAKG